MEQTIIDQLFNKEGYKNHRIVESPMGDSFYLEVFSNSQGWLLINTYARKTNALKAVEKRLIAIYRKI